MYYIVQLSTLADVLLLYCDYKLNNSNQIIQIIPIKFLVFFYFIFGWEKGTRQKNRFLKFTALKASTKDHSIRKHTGCLNLAFKLNLEF